MTEATLSAADLDTWKQEFMRDLQGRFAPMATADDVQRLQGWRKKMEADGSFGRIFNGPQWLDGVAIRDGVISGAKLKADLVISNTFRTNDPTTDPTGDRMELDSAGLRWYGTVSGTPNTKIVDFSPSGFEIGNGSNKISYVASTGVLTVPAGPPRRALPARPARSCQPTWLPWSAHRIDGDSKTQGKRQSRKNRCS